MLIKKRLLSLAVANVSLSLAAESLAVEPVTGISPSDCAIKLQQALNDVDSVLGETVVIDVATCPVISLSGTITVADKPVIIQAPVAADGRPQVVITADSVGFGLFSFDNSSPVPAESDPIIISGLELSGAASAEAGGAIAANNHILVLDKSVISDNSAVGAGGGIYVAGELCLQGSELTDNTVTHSIAFDGDSVANGASAVGGGAAVNGATMVKPSFAADFEFPGNTPPDDCLTGTGAAAIFTAVSAQFNESAAALADNHPAGLDIIASKITGNTALVEMDMADIAYPGDSGVAALGGGLASFSDGVARDDSIAADSKYGEGVTLWQAVIADNAATVGLTNTSELAAPKYVVSAGGGVFAGTDGIGDGAGALIQSKYVEVRDNTVSLTGIGAGRQLAMGGGLAASYSEVLQDISAGWLDSLGEGYSESGEPLAFSALLASEVSGNTVQLSTTELVGGYAENSADIALGGGVAVVSTDPKYSESSALVSLLSTVSGNTVAVSGGTNGYSEAAYTHAAGGGLAVGDLILDADAPSRIANLKYGTYYSICIWQ